MYARQYVAVKINARVRDRDDLDTYAKEMETLAKTLLYLMGKALGMVAKDMDGMFEDGYRGMRMNYYPTCPQP